MKEYRTNIDRLEQSYPIIQVISKLFIPFILLFAFYVQFHGDFGPGGGFQAGIIFSSAFILYGLIFGEALTRLIMPPQLLRFLMSSGILIYAGTGVVSLFFGGQYLDYSVLMIDPQHGQHWGIFTVELGVGLTVSGVMITLFYGFSSKR